MDRLLDKIRLATRMAWTHSAVDKDMYVFPTEYASPSTPQTIPAPRVPMYEAAVQTKLGGQRTVLCFASIQTLQKKVDLK